MPDIMNEDVLPPAEADATLAALLGMTPPAVAEPIDLDARGREFLAGAKRRTSIARYEADCAKGYPVSDWNHSGLIPYRHAIDHVRSWQFGPKGLLLTGPTGRGKTRAIFDLYRRMAHEWDHEVRYYFAGDWFARLQEQISFGRDDARGWVEATAAHPIVIIDDLGQEAVTAARADWSESHFFRFLDLRVSARLPLICSTNLTSEEIAGKAGRGSGVRHEPLIRRLLDLTEVVKFQPAPESK